MIVDLSIDICAIEPKKPPRFSFIPWNKLSSDVLENYRAKLNRELSNMDINFHAVLHADCLCDDAEHMMELEKYLTMIIDAVSAADAILPRTLSRTQKDYWSSELTDLKRKSKDAYNEWQQAGSPKQGMINEIKVILCDLYTYFR